MTGDLRAQLQKSLGHSYRLERELGGGGMSRVFLAEETSLGRKVVVKVLPPDLAASVNLERFRREIQLAARLQHPHIVPVHAAGDSEGLPYYTMPFIEGESLHARLDRDGELPVNDAVRILRDVLSALSYAHQHGVVHRDIKPDNILLTGPHAVVADFGVAKAISAATSKDASLTSIGIALGTPAYMSPEQATADPSTDHRADLYSVAAVGYEMLTGQQLFSARSAQAMIAAHMTEAPEPISKRRPTVPPPLAEVIMRALEKRAADRPQSADEMLAQVDASVASSGATTPHLGGAQPSRSNWVSRPRILGLVAGALLATLALVAYRYSGMRAGAAATPATTPPSIPTVAALDSRRVLVAAFENRTGDPKLDPLGYMVADWIAQGLARTGLARVVPFSTVVQETPHLTAEGSAPGVGPPNANRQFARRVGAGILLAGAYYRAGDTLAFQAQVIDVATGELLRGIDGVRASPDRPAAAAEELQRRSLGVLATLFDERIASWPDPASQPASLETYQLFSEGMHVFLSANRYFGTREGERLNRTAAEKFLTAAAVDSTFATPLLWAAYAYINAGDSAAARSAIRAVETRPLSAWSRAVVDHQLAVLAHDAEAQYHAARALAELSPDSEWLFKLGFSAYETRRPRSALDAFMRVDPDRGWIKNWPSYWRLRSETQHVLGNYTAELEDVRRGQASYPDDAWLRTLELGALAALGRADEMLARLAPRLADGDVFALADLNSSIEELRAHGHRSAADHMLSRAIGPAKALAVLDTSNFARGQLAFLLYHGGRQREAAAEYRVLAKEAPDAAEFRIRLAIIGARLGDQRPAIEVLDWLGTLDGDALRRAGPSPGSLRYFWGSHDAWLAFSKAVVTAQLGHRDRTIEFVREAIDRGLRHSYLNLHKNSDFESVRSQPGFQRLLRPRG